jgi:hypothetical protein
MKERVVTGRLVRQGPEEKRFNREFWRTVDSAERLAAVWDMVAEADRIKGKNVGKSRLQRSVQNILRRTG